VSFCIANTDGGLWVTTDDGGLSATAATSPATRPLAAPAAAGAQAGHPVTVSLPRVSGAHVSARIGHVATVTGQYHPLALLSRPVTSVRAAVRSPGGASAVQSLPIGKNNYYSMKLASVPAGTTTVTFTAKNAKPVTVHVAGYQSAAPQVSGLSAHAGPLGGANKLTITGSGFRHVTAVDFGSKRATDVTVKSATSLTVKVPAGAVQARYVTVVTAAGGPSPLTGRSLYNYLPAPSVSRISPGSGRAAGGTTVTITGVDLAYVRGIFFGTHRATHLIVISPRKITVTAPAGKGTVDVRVAAAGGESKIITADRFKY
jgi:hypothetical protein